MKKRVIGIGDNVCDKYYPSKIMYPGGQAMNFSVYAKKLGADAAYMGVFGTDSVASHIIHTLDQFQIDYSRCRQYKGENGYAKVRLENGEREFIMSNKGGIVNEYPLDLNKEDLEYIRGFHLVHTSCNGHFDSQIFKVKEAGVPISYDFSGRWKQEAYIDTISSVIDYGFFSCPDASEDEIRQLCRRVVSNGCSLAIVTRGKNGSVVYDGIQFYSHVPKPVDALDTLGAGDSFAAAFLLSLLDTEDIETSMEAGAQFAADTCMINGAFGCGIPFEDS